MPRRSNSERIFAIGALLRLMPKRIPEDNFDDRAAPSRLTSRRWG